MVKHTSLFSESKKRISAGNIRKAVSQSLSLHDSPIPKEGDEGNQEEGVKKKT
jgi:hypothetical protein